MQGCAASLVSLVYVHISLVYKVEQRRRLVTLCRYVQHISTIDVAFSLGRSHFIYQYLDDIHVAVIRCEE
jgi:hypothetical protein